eukprot:UN23082
MLLRVSGHCLALFYNCHLVPYIDIKINENQSEDWILYWTRLKELYHIKNITSTLGCLTTLFCYPLSYYHIKNAQVTEIEIICLLVWFFLFQMSLEIICDIRDFEGDAQQLIPTYPVVHGIPFGRNVAFSLDIIAFLFISFSYSTGYVRFELVLLAIASILKIFSYIWLNKNDFSGEKYPSLEMFIIST